MTDAEFLTWCERQVGTATQFVFLPLSVSERLSRLARNASRLYAIRHSAQTGGQDETKWSGQHILHSVRVARNIIIREAIKKLTS